MKGVVSSLRLPANDLTSCANSSPCQPSIQDPRTLLDLSHVVVEGLGVEGSELDLSREPVSGSFFSGSFLGNTPF